jgi:heme-degrading monooxygenase HmoA
MYSRVTLLEIDTIRTSVEEAVEAYETEVAAGLHELEGFEGSLVLTTPDGRGMIITLWKTEEDARATAGFASEAVERRMTLFRATPGREYYEVAFAELPANVA